MSDARRAEEVVWRRIVAQHEAGHCAAALVLGLEPDLAEVAHGGGRVRVAPGDLRKHALVTLAGRMCDDRGEPWPPRWPLSTSHIPDEVDLSRLVEELRLDRPGWDELVSEAHRLVCSESFDGLHKAIAAELECGGRLERPELTRIKSATAEAVRTKTAVAEIDAYAGEFDALVAVFHVLDSHGDRIVPGAFAETLAEWRASGDPIPVVWNHQHSDPWSHIGAVDPRHARETGRGLRVRGRLDVADNAVARQVHRLMARRSIREFSFGYRVPRGGERIASDGVNEITKIKLVEVGPTLKGSNPATELHSVKSLAAAEDRQLRRRARDEMLDLLAAAGKPGVKEPSPALFSRSPV